MIKLLNILVFIFISAATFAQVDLKPVKEFYNLDCEKVPPGRTLPSRWNVFSASTKQYIAIADTTEKHSGKYALLLTPKKADKKLDSGYIAFPLPAKFIGKEITLKAWMKLQDVQNYAGLMLRLNDIQGNAIQLSDPENQKINGTRNWAQYSVTLPLPVNAAMIYIGPVLAGKGKLWADDFEILIDGIDVRDAALKPGYKTKGTVETIYGNNLSAGKHLKLKDADLYYETYGKGEPLLLLHGNNQSINAFSNQIPVLAEKYKVIAVDTRGQGRSTDNSTGPLTYEQFANDMKLLIDSLHITKANILGWSDGGNTALIMAINYPDHVNKMAITGTVLNSSEDAIDGKVLDEIKNQIEELKDKTDGYSLEQKRLLTMLLNEPHISVESLKSIKAPTLVMAGDKDLVKEKHTRTIAENIPNSKLLIFKDASHYVPAEKSREFNSAVIDFLGKGK